MHVFFALLTLAILALYGVTLWRLLRSESTTSLGLLLILTAIALLLRLVDWGSYPGGLNDDEPKMLYSAIAALKSENILGEGPTGLPELVPLLFQAQLVPLLGAGRWAIRLYSLICSVLSVGATLAVARAMRMRPISSLAAAAFVVFLPWSLFFGRISQGGELLFNQLLVLAALARLVWRDGTWREIPSGAVGLCLLFYDYFSGRSMLAMPFVAAVLANRQRRLLCIGVAAVAMLGFLPYALSGHQYALVGLSMVEVHPSYSNSAIETFSTKTFNALTTLAYPTSANAWMTVSSAAMHPWFVLALAGLGLLTGFRRAVFLGAGFFLGLMPNIVAHGDLYASAHRIHSAYIFVALAAGASFDLIPWRTVRAAAAGAVVTLAAFWSLGFFFSPDFWRPEAVWMFNNDDTELVESIPWKEPQVVEIELGQYILMRDDLKPIRFTAEHLSLPAHKLYAFGRSVYPLQLFYKPLLRSNKLQSFGDAFSVRADEQDPDWLAGHGWTYTVECGATRRTGQLPTLFHFYYTYSDVRCGRPAIHTWRGRWREPASNMRLWYGGGTLSVETSPGEKLTADGSKPSFDFHVEAGAEITIQITGRPNIMAALYVVTPINVRLPYWESVDPM